MNQNVTLLRHIYELQFDLEFHVTLNVMRP